MAATSGTRPASAGRLYTADQRRRRDASIWTPVQGVLAALQFLAFAVSLVLVLRFLMSGAGLGAATVSVIVKTAFLYTIMITGALWERDVYGRYLFAPAFFWEDVVSMAVIALHSAYLLAWLYDLGTPTQQMLLALAAYAAYSVNATQFLLKFRRARRDVAWGEGPEPAPAAGLGLALAESRG
ncbi:MAG: 2-vinyl bacteriochlorophyllide hydratase [Pseudomonadales bacterium]